MTKQSMLARVAAPASDLGDVLKRMEKIRGDLARNDGLHNFHEAYIEVTKRVVDVIDTSGFADNRFVNRLDVNFANEYLRAVQLAETHPRFVPRAWVPVLLDKRYDTSRTPEQFVFAALVAHLFHDLPLAVVDTCIELKTDPDAGPHESDFNTVNALIRKADSKIRRLLLAGTRGGRVPEEGSTKTAFELWSVEAMRAAAWGNAEVLWRLRNARFLYDAYETTLDRAAELASRTMLYSPV